MAGYCETFDHTADVGLRAQADTLGELLAALADGLAELICPRGQVRPADVRPCRIQAEDVEALTVDFLWDVMSAVQYEHFVVSRVEVQRADETSVQASLHGEPYDPARHELETEVKAVTYHQLQVARDGDQWIAQVILDL